MAKFNLNLYETLYNLSDALDLVGGEQNFHCKRVAYLAMTCANALNWPQAHQDELFLAAILHDCGVYNTAIHSRLTLFEASNIGNHCLEGAELLQKNPLLAYLADYIRYHHTPWQELLITDLPDLVKIITNFIYMVDRVDILVLNCLAADANILACRDFVRKKIHAKRSHWFHPELVDILIKISEPEAFWLTFADQPSLEFAYTRLKSHARQEIAFNDLKSIVRIFSHIIDAKSPFTLLHSERVAALARLLGELCQLPEHTCDELELAGLLHDLGMLRVADEIFDKPGSITESEYLSVQRHSYDTYQVLKNISGFENIANWAAQHHERLDGSGYPYRLTHTDISLASGIIAVADVFQSLSQKRAYRDAFPANAVLAMLTEQGQSHKLHPTVINQVQQHFAQCWQVATSETV